MRFREVKYKIRTRFAKNSSKNMKQLYNHSLVHRIMTVHVLLWLCFFQVAFGISTEVTVGDLGDIIGVVDYTEWNNRSIFAFRGIPYAEPPVGDLRFRPPVKITSWNRTLNATSYGPACPQSTGFSYSEDCLTLNVFVPEIENNSDNVTLLPVLIYIHGGTFRTGQASAYKPLRLVDEADLIVVVLQYRLGFLGLFSLLTDDAPGNVQFLDQIMAMEWVQDNIQYFGGDKSRVTLWGHSSGAASVHFHLLSPLTEGLFHRTILESGSALRTYGIDTNPIESAIILSNYCGCQNMTDVDEIAVCMRAISAEGIINCTANYLSETIYDGLTRARGHTAVIQKSGDRRFLTADPKELIANGEYLKLPMLGGVTKNDGSIYFKGIYDDVLYPNGLVDDAEYARYNLTAYTLKYLGVSDITNGVLHTMMKTYFTNEQLGDLVSMAPGLIDICSLVSYKSGSYETFYANRKFQDTYVYTFDYRVYDPNSESPLYPFDTGVTHSDDIKLFFPQTDDQRENDVDMAKVMIKLWTSFVIDGIPTADGVTWPKMSTPVGPYLVIDSYSTSLKDNFLDEFVTSRSSPSFMITALRINSWQLLVLIVCFVVGIKMEYII